MDIAKHSSSVLIFVCCVCGGLFSLAQPSKPSSGTLINEVIFSIGDESSTARDYQLYHLVLNEVFQKKNLSEFTSVPSDDFLLSRLCFKEAQTFEIQAVSFVLTESVKKKLSQYSKVEIDREIEVISKALGLIEIKESQLKQKERFQAWFELIKRKYRVKPKA